MPASPLHLAVALDGAGWHPAAWREPDARPRDLLTAGYWLDLVQEAERGLLDFVTIEDALALQSADPFRPDERTDQVRGRLDAVQIAARVAPLTEHIGLVPTAIVTHTEPFHLSKAIATLDYVSTGRAGVQVRVSLREHEARLFGRRSFPPLEPADPAAGPLIEEAFAEAADYVEVLRRLWDSWEDDAEIRDVATGRFVDRDEAALHRLRGALLLGAGPVDHAAATAGPADRGGAGPPGRALSAGRRLGRRRLRDPAGRRRTPPRSSTRSAARRRRPDARRRPCTCSATSWSSSTSDEPAARARKARLDDLAGAEYSQRRDRVHRDAGRPRRPARRVAGGPGCPVSGCGPARCRTT